MNSSVILEWPHRHARGNPSKSFDCWYPSFDWST